MSKIHLVTAKSAMKWLRTNVPNWKPDMVDAVRNGYNFNVTLIVDGKLKKVEVNGNEFDKLLPKLIEYFDGKPWDDCTYHRIYETNPAHPHDAVFKSDVYQCKNEDEAGDFVDEWRRKINSNVGVTSVVKPAKWIPYLKGRI